MRYLAALLSLLCACSATADGPSGAEDAADAATPTDAHEGDAGAPEADAAGLWTEWVCRLHGGSDLGPWCSAAQSRDAGPGGAWCTLLDLRDGDTGLVPWSECLRYAVAGMPASLRPAWDRLAAAGCTYPPALCDVSAWSPACSGLRVYSGGSVQGLLGRAVAVGRCWPRAL